jgi:hypothetical protein
LHALARKRNRKTRIREAEALRQHGITSDPGRQAPRKAIAN